MRWVAGILVLALISAGAAWAQGSSAAAGGLLESLPDLNRPSAAGQVLQWVVLITVLSLAPAVLMMVTSFTRIMVVLGLLRQALATQQLPPNQVLMALALFMSLVIMAPVYTQVYQQAVQPYLEGRMTGQQALATAQQPVRGFMIQQVEAAHNEQDVFLFLSKDLAGRSDLAWSAVPTLSLIPAFIVSELKVAFMIGLRIFLPFVVVDMLVSAVLVSMGMLMLPPVLISMPFKLLLFVLADGWRLVVGTLIRSFS
jgi:flagellar biosynthetic protein FliP